MPASPEAAAELLAAIESGEGLIATEDLEGVTDCPNGCEVEPDGTCCHGWQSAVISAGVM